MGVIRLGYVHLRVTDIEEAKRHYRDTVGFRIVQDEGKTVYLKGWDEWDHHSIVLHEGGIGVHKLGFKVNRPEDIDDVEAKCRAFGVTTERMSRGDNPETSDGIRITAPSTHSIEVYHDMTLVGSEVGHLNPEVFPRTGLTGFAAPHIDHALIGTNDGYTMQRFFMDVFGFYCTERLIPDLDHPDTVLASWLSQGNRGHDIAIIQGDNWDGKLHHVAFQLQEWSDILHAAQIMSMDRVPIDVGPTQHGITRGKTIYYFDPSGNRNEVFADGYTNQRDRPTNIWTADCLGPGIDYLTRTLSETFTTIVT